jgi:dipeptidyl aminopeptidase/acylaminoacyl peptidase
MRARDRRIPDGRLRPAPLRRTVSIFATILVTAVVAYAAVAALVWLLQERLLFYPTPVSVAPVAPAGWRLEAFEQVAADGTRLAGVLLLPPRAQPRLVVYFGGNAEEVTASAMHAAQTYGERAVLLLNYRGYGASLGRPGERELIADALEVIDKVRARTDVDSSRIAVHGRSLGSGVAVQVAAARPVCAVVLSTPFSSALSVAQDLYWWLPVRLLMRHPFDSLARAPRIQAPALFLVGSEDTLIRPAQSWRLADAWGGPVERRTFTGFGHNDIQLDPEYDRTIRGFLDRHC